MNFPKEISRKFEVETTFMFHLKGTVILRIWWQIILVILYASLLSTLHFVEWISIDYPDSLISILGAVTGLLLVFRTNTAYDRYWEGRKLWSIMTKDIRTLARMIWVCIEEKDGTAEEILEKITALNLLVAFAYATRNYLRGNYSYEEEDLKGLIGHLQKFLPEEKSNAKGNSWRLQTKNYHIKAYEKSVPTNIPIEITYYITQYIHSVGKRKLVDFCGIGAMNTAVNSLVECLGGFERILRTPIPLAYSVHLHHATWIYLLALPFQLIGKLKWFTIPAIGLAAFCLLGILAIALEIENPFGYDDNDLPLDDFCKVIHKEIICIAGQTLPPVKMWVLSPHNYPIPTEDCLGADKLRNMQGDYIRKLLVKNAMVGLSKRKSQNDLESVETPKVSINK